MCSRKCDKCGKCVPSGYCYCDECREVADAEHWARLPKKKWGGEGMIYSDAYSEYFADVDSLDEWILEHGLIESYDDLRLVICTPTYAHPLSSDSWEDELPNDGEDVPDWLGDAIDEFNKALEGKPPLSYQPGNVAVDTSDWEIPKEDDDV